MVKKVKSLTAIGCCLRLNPHIISRIREADWRISNSAESTSDYSEKKVILPHIKVPISMKAALVVCLVSPSKKFAS